MSDIRFTTETQDMTGCVEYQVGVVDGKQMERVRIVAWLRDCAHGIRDVMLLGEAASCIEKGEHWDE